MELYQKSKLSIVVAAQRSKPRIDWENRQAVLHSSAQYEIERPGQLDRPRHFWPSGAINWPHVPVSRNHGGAGGIRECMPRVPSFLYPQLRAEPGVGRLAAGRGLLAGPRGPTFAAVGLS